VPWGAVLHPGERLDEVTTPDALPYPLVVKPAWEGSSKGIRAKCLADRPDEVVEAVTGLWHDHQQPGLVGEYIAREGLTVGVLATPPPRVLGVMRVVPLQGSERFLYSLEVKREWQQRVRYECPARLPPGALAAVEHAALAAYRVLGCRDVARVDFRLRD